MLFFCFMINCIFCYKEILTSHYNFELHNQVSTICKPGEKQPISIYHYHHLLVTHMRGHKSSSDLREAAVIDALASAADSHNSLFIELIIWSIRYHYYLKHLSISAIPLSDAKRGIRYSEVAKSN